MTMPFTEWGSVQAWEVGDVFGEQGGQRGPDGAALMDPAQEAGGTHQGHTTGGHSGFGVGGDGQDADGTARLRGDLVIPLIIGTVIAGAMLAVLVIIAACVAAGREVPNPRPDLRLIQGGR
jgi:hypothetical protein